MICAELGIDDCDFTNGAAYIAEWLAKLRDDKKEVFRAASDAQRIADYLLAFHPDYAARSTARLSDADSEPAESPPPSHQAAFAEAA
jgi:antirestriction protein ArdC